MFGRIVENGPGACRRQTPGVPVKDMGRLRAAPCENRGIVIVVRQIMLMTVHCPQQVNLLAVGVAMILDHLQRVLNVFQDLRNMGGGWNGGPDEEAGAQQACKQLPPARSPCKSQSGQADPHPFFAYPSGITG